MLKDQETRLWFSFFVCFFFFLTDVFFSEAKKEKWKVLFVEMNLDQVHEILISLNTDQ